MSLINSPVAAITFLKQHLYSNFKEIKQWAEIAGIRQIKRIALYPKTTDILYVCVNGKNLSRRVVCRCVAFLFIHNQIKGWVDSSEVTTIPNGEIVRVRGYQDKCRLLTSNIVHILQTNQPYKSFVC